MHRYRCRCGHGHTHTYTPVVHIRIHTHIHTMVVLSQRPCLPASNVTLLAEGGEDEASAEEESASADSFLSVAFCMVRFVGPVVDGARPGLLHVHLFALLFEPRCSSETPVLPLLLLGLLLPPPPPPCPPPCPPTPSLSTRTHPVAGPRTARPAAAGPRACSAGRGTGLFSPSSGR